MKRIVVSLIVPAALLSAVFGAAAAISLNGVDQLDGGQATVSDIETAAACTSPTGLVGITVTCSTAPTPTPTPTPCPMC